MNRAAAKLLENPVQLAIGAGLIVGLLYWIGRTTATQAAGAVGGIVSGNNAVTRGTPYEEKGLLGTVGAVTNEASGGALENIGSWIGLKIYDLTHAPDEYDPTTGLLNPGKIIAQAGDNIDAIWGRIGNVILRN